MDRPSLQNQTALITGATSPLGRAIAALLAAQGERLILHANSNAEAAQTLAQTLPQPPTGEHSVVVADLAQANEVERVADAAISAGATLLVCNAAVYLRTPLDELTREQWDATFAVNTTAPIFLASRMGLALKQQQKQGAFVMITDAHTARPYRDYLPYLASKAALESAVKILALELAPYVRVNAVAPGLITTTETHQENWIKNIPLQRLGTPDDVAQAVLYLLRADYTTGTILPVDGARTLR